MSLWSYINSLFAPQANAQGVGPDGQPITSAPLPPAQSLPQLPASGQGAPGLQMTPAYLDPTSMRLPGIGRPTAAAGLPQRTAAAPPQQGPASASMAASLPQTPDQPPQAVAQRPSLASSLPQQQAAPPVKPVHGVLMNFIDKNLLGGAVGAHDQQVLDNQQILYSRQLAQQFAGSLPNDNLRAQFWADPHGFLTAWEKNIEPQKLAAKETLVPGGNPAGAFTAPDIITDNGNVISASPGGAHLLATTGPDVDPATGVDKRSGYQFGVSTPQQLGPGVRPGVFNSGGPSPAAPQQTALYQAGPATTAGSSTLAAQLPQTGGDASVPARLNSAVAPLPKLGARKAAGTRITGGNGAPGGQRADGVPSGAFMIPGKAGYFQRDYMGQVHPIEGTGLPPAEEAYQKGQGEEASKSISSDLDARAPAMEQLSNAKIALSYVQAHPGDMNPMTPHLVAGANYLRSLPPSALKAVGVDPTKIDQYANDAAVYQRLSSQNLLSFSKSNLPSRYTEREMAVAGKVIPQLSTAPDAASFHWGLQAAIANKTLSKSEFSANYTGEKTKQAIEQQWAKSHNGQTSLFQDPIWQNVQIGGKPAVIQFQHNGETWGAVGAGSGHPTFFKWVN